MKEKPILFSGPMVRAILDGHKTQTRRVVNPQPAPCWSIEPVEIVNGNWSSRGCRSDLKCPYETRGLLWVRETWGWIGDHHHKDHRSIYWKADRDDWMKTRKWRPSIFMPRWACRLTLEIASVRVERLQSMTFNDWVADFCPSSVERESALETFVGDANRRRMAKDFWDSINAKRGFGWDKNPWVWVISFKRVA